MKAIVTAGWARARRWAVSPPVRWAWQTGRRGLPMLLAAAVSLLVLRQALTLDWRAVNQALRDLPGPVLWTAGIAAVAGHAVFAGYDVIARRVVRHRATAARSALIGAIAYALNLNFGALIGGVAVRLRLYQRAGVPLASGSAVVLGGMVANWCGWALLLAGALLWADPLPWPVESSPLGRPGRLAVAALVLVVPLGLLAACARYPGRAIRWGSSSVGVPSARHGGAWCLLAMLSWALASTVVWLLLQDAVPWWTVCGAMLLAAVAGVVTHVPAGLGVLEAVVVAALGGSVPTPTVLAALLAYRFVYYGLPLLAAGAAYAALEGSAARSASSGTDRKGMAHSMPGDSACSSSGDLTPSPAGRPPRSSGSR